MWTFFMAALYVKDLARKTASHFIIMVINIQYNVLLLWAESKNVCLLLS